MPTATLRWGLAIPANKFDALLHCFERHDPNYINPGTGAETISERLQKYLLAATEGPESFSAFYVEVSPYEIKVTHPRSTKHVQRWGINACEY
ncbi:hypothetical protein BOTBODRAFT_35245 [Botryobasidium botryosum FD-172 SS1]|uniref:Uncharacterized protein n=1 Tax=Botryobasidium botryosum (strain FD-172 SS1) TaxID=930990 RepID=A0A067MI53_BOTB1|nr:hypothetical protein BOTBODRAFT_35245 [Botryobasidium botryosum FD-172 SS1]